MNHEALIDSSFVQAVSDKAGLDAATTARVVVAMLTLLGKRLRPADATVVAQRLPDELAAVLLAQPYEGEGDPEELVQAAGDERLPRVVLRHVAERLDEQARAQLRMINLRRFLA